MLCLVPQDSDLATKGTITPAGIAEHPLIGTGAGDPHGRALADMLGQEGLSVRMSVTTRFGATVRGLVAAGLGIAVVDEFTLEHGGTEGVRCLEIEADTSFPIYAAFRNDTPLSIYAEEFVGLLREETACRRGAGHELRRKVT